MNALIIPAGRDLIREIIPRIEADGMDYSGTLVVFPGRRPSHFLRKAMAEKIRASFIPPVMPSMDEFVDDVYDHLSSGRKLEAIDAVSILYDIHREAQHPLGGQSFMTPDSFFTIGLRIYRDLEELYIEGIRFNQVRDIQPFADELIPEQSLKRIQSLSFFYEEFYKRIEERRFSTRAFRYRRAAEKIEEVITGRFNKIIFAGFYALTATEKKMFRKMFEMDNALFIFQDGIGVREKLRETGITFDEIKTEDKAPDIHFYRSPDTHGQVYALSSMLETMDSGLNGYDEKTAIVLPSSETLFPLLRQGLSGIDEDMYNISTGYPLLRTPVFGFLNNLMELINSMEGDRVYVPDYLKFILHPYTKNIYFKGSAEITRIMFHALEQGLSETRTRTFLGLAELEEDERLLRHIMEKIPVETGDIRPVDIKKHLKTMHRNTIERFLSFKSVGDFAGKCTELLSFIFNQSTARLHPLFYPFSESFIRALDVISRSLMKDIAFAETSSYFTFFRRYISTCHTPFEGTPIRGLQVLGFLETRNLKFDRVFIMDANEDVIPDTKKEDTLIPFKARKILGLPTYIDRDRLVAYYFETLIRGAKEAHLFFVENDRKERSRFVERLLWERQKTDRTTDDREYLKSVQYKVSLINIDPADIRKTPDVAAFLKGFTYSATAVDGYLRCPLKFYYSYVLGIGKKDGISGEIERVDIGKFVHNLLSGYFSQRRGRPLEEKDIDTAEMGRLIDRDFKTEYGGETVGAVYLLKKQIERRMKDLLLNYYLPLIREKSVTILQTEGDVKAKVGSFKLKGRLDSIEKRDEQTCIIDFKTGSNQEWLKIRFDKLDLKDRETWDEAIGSLQLPFYLMIYSAVTGKDINELEGMFLLLGMLDISRAIELPFFGDASHEREFAVMKTIITRLLEEIVDENVPFSPAGNKKENCSNCDFQYICGTQWIVK